MLLWLALPTALTVAHAEQTVLRNDVAYDDSFDMNDSVAWLDYPECAISVLTPDPADLPLEIHTIQVYLGSSQGNQDGDDSMLILGVQNIPTGTAPTGRGSWVWGEEAFYVTVSSRNLNELDLDDAAEGLFPITLTEGALAVWVCAPDPDTGFSWPFVNATDTSGIVIDTGSPNAGNYLWYRDRIWNPGTFATGSWIIRAVAGEGDVIVDTGDPDPDPDPGGDDTGQPDPGGDDTGEEPAATLNLSSILPATAVEGGGISVAVLGEGFTEGASLHIGGLPASSVVIESPTSLTATTPSALPAGVHDVLLTNADGTAATLAGAFTVTRPGELEEDDDDDKGGICGCSGAGGLAGSVFLVPLLALWRRRAFVIG